MNYVPYIKEKTAEVSWLYWELVKTILPIVILTQILIELGFIKWAAPFFEPLMQIFGLPPELAFAWLTGVFAGIWAGIVVLFAVISPAELTIAEVSIYSSLLLFAHALPIEQRIIQRAGPGFWVTTAFRFFGGILYAWLVHHSINGVEAFNQPISPLWLPEAQDSGWIGFLIVTAETFFWMLIILAGLVILLDALKQSGILDFLQRLLLPIFKPAGLKKETSSLVSVGLLLGITFGGGLLIREARSGTVSNRQIFLACTFMGFAHSLIEDTLLVMAIGADVSIVLVGRVIFAIVATGLIALLLKSVSERTFSRYLFNTQPQHV